MSFGSPDAPVGSPAGVVVLGEVGLGVLRPVGNPPSRHRLDHVELEVPPSLARPQVFEDDSQSVLSRNDSPDLLHRWSVNPYRGCMHACA